MLHFGSPGFNLAADMRCNHLHRADLNDLVLRWTNNTSPETQTRTRPGHIRSQRSLHRLGGCTLQSSCTPSRNKRHVLALSSGQTRSKHTIFVLTGWTSEPSSVPPPAPTALLCIRHAAPHSLLRISRLRLQGWLFCYVQYSLVSLALLNNLIFLETSEESCSPRAFGCLLLSVSKDTTFDGLSPIGSPTRTHSVFQPS